MSGLPSCSIQYPSCGACGCHTDYDGDTFYCDDCRLDYGRGEDGETATYRDEEAGPCGTPCDNEWHGPDKIRGGWTYLCQPCALPAGHTSDHWTNCSLVMS